MSQPPRMGYIKIPKRQIFCETHVPTQVFRSVLRGNNRFYDAQSAHGSAQKHARTKILPHRLALPGRPQPFSLSMPDTPGNPYDFTGMDVTAAADSLHSGIVFTSQVVNS